MSNYGWRARIGLIYPSSGRRDLDFQRLCPPGVSTHVTRVAFGGEGTLEQIGRMSATENLVIAARLLADLHPASITWADTSGSFMFGPDGPQRQARAMQEVSGVPCSNTTLALLLALRRLGVNRIAVAAPYLREVTDKLEEFLGEQGVEVGRLETLDLLEEGEVSRVYPERVYQLARSAWFEGAEALFISCTDFEALDQIQALESDLGKPVLSSNQVTMWHALRLAGVREPVAGFGTIMGMDVV